MGNILATLRQRYAAMWEEVKQEGHRADALALRADERRDKLRKAAGRGTCPVIRRCLNGETHMGEAPMYPCANT